MIDTNQASEDMVDDFYSLPPTYRTKENLRDYVRTEKLKLLNELDRSMPTAEQLTTKYGYHMPDKQYGYKLALHDIREVLAKLEAEL